MEEKLLTITEAAEILGFQSTRFVVGTVAENWLQSKRGWRASVLPKKDLEIFSRILLNLPMIG